MFHSAPAFSPRSIALNRRLIRLQTLTLLLLFVVVHLLLSMPPKKRAAASASRKPNQGNQPSQPSKFGIQHFFERHSQSQAAAPSVAASGHSKPYSVRNPNHPSATAANGQLPHLPDNAPANAVEESSQISPSVVKSSAKKRFKFSPGMVRFLMHPSKKFIFFLFPDPLVCLAC